MTPPRPPGPLGAAFILTLTLSLSLALPGRASGPAQPSQPPGSSADEQVLQRAELVRQVLASNPNAAAAREAWQSALAAIPQRTALEDPTLSYGFAPLSIGSDVRFGQEIQLSQGLPFPGKRNLRGSIAEAEAEATRGEWHSAQLRLALMASTLFDELFVVDRSLETNAEHLALLSSLEQSAEAQYVAGRASQQDALQAEVELSRVLQDRLALESARERLRAQLNALLHRPPSAQLPSPPKALEQPGRPSKSSEALQEEALRQRPELASLRARLGGSDAAVALAKREYLPDFMLMGSYNNMFMDKPHQFMAGVAVNLPILTGKRRAAIEEAEGERRRLRQEELALLDELRAEVAQALSRLDEAYRSDALLHQRLLPAARDQLAAARAGFEAGKNNFQTLLEAERSLRNIQLQIHESSAAIHTRHAELARALGSVPDLPTAGVTP